MIFLRAAVREDSRSFFVSKARLQICLAASLDSLRRVDQFS